MKRIRTLLQLTVFVQLIGALFVTANAAGSGSDGFGTGKAPTPTAITSSHSGSDGFGTN